MSSNRLIFTGFVFVFLLLAFGCINQPTCNSPYILVGNDCCLDANNNTICDKDEVQPVQNQTQNQVQEQDQNQSQQQNQTQQTGNTTQETVSLCNSPYIEYMTGFCCLDANQNQICDKDETTQQGNQTIPAQNQSSQNTTQENGTMIQEPVPFCGDTICDSNESTANCCNDCGCTAGSTCSNNACKTFQGFGKIPQIEFQLLQFCGDGMCNNNENSSTCCNDCNCSGTMICSNNSCVKSGFKIITDMSFNLIPFSSEIKITDAEIAENVKPRISQYFVTWHQYFSGNPDIMLYNIQTKNTAKLSNYSSQYNPDISGMRLVWNDYGRATGAENSDVYFYDIPNMNEGFLTSRIEYKSGQVIDNNYVAWIEQSGYDKVIYLFDLSTNKETKLTSGDIYPGNIDISGNNVVWGYYNCDYAPCHYGVTLYNINTKTKTKILETSGYADHFSPRIHNDMVVFISGNEPNAQIQVYNITSKITQQITGTQSLKGYPSIYNNTIVWQDKRNGNWDIYTYDLKSKIEKALVNETHDQLFPDVYGNKVIYHDKRAGRHIYQYTLSG